MIKVGWLSKPDVYVIQLLSHWSWREWHTARKMLRYAVSEEMYPTLWVDSRFGSLPLDTDDIEWITKDLEKSDIAIPEKVSNTTLPACIQVEMPSIVACSNIIVSGYKTSTVLDMCKGFVAADRSDTFNDSRDAYIFATADYPAGNYEVYVIEHIGKPENVTEPVQPNRNHKSEQPSTPPRNTRSKNGQRGRRTKTQR